MAASHSSADTQLYARQEQNILENQDTLLRGWKPEEP
jgi:hypothetical protein